MSRKPNGLALPFLVTTSNGDTGYMGQRIVSRHPTLERALFSVHNSGWDDAPDIEIYQLIER